MPPVCLDASLVLLWFLREPLSTRADALLQEWRTDGVEFIAPSLLMLEVPSVLRQAVHRGRVTTAEGDETLHAFLEMDIRIREPSDLLNRTWELGKTLNAPRLYDMYYLALAEIEACELWTADQRFVNLVAPHSALVRLVGENADG